MNKIFIYSDFKDLFGDFCQVSSVTMPASLPPQLAKLIQKYPQNHSHINLNSFLNFGKDIENDFVISVSLSLILSLVCGCRDLWWGWSLSFPAG